METPSAPLSAERFSASQAPRWISLQDCAVLHEMMLLRYGGASGVRDLALLEAVVAAPKERFAAGVTGLAELAACYGNGLARQRPFVSGNLASAFLISVGFLGCNGLRFTGNDLLFVQVMLRLAEGQHSPSEFAHYLRCNCDPI